MHYNTTLLPSVNTLTARGMCACVCVCALLLLRIFLVFEPSLAPCFIELLMFYC